MAISIWTKLDSGRITYGKGKFESYVDDSIISFKLLAIQGKSTEDSWSFPEESYL